MENANEPQSGHPAGEPGRPPPARFEGGAYSHPADEEPIREWLRFRLAAFPKETSHRIVAGEVGISVGAVEKFLAGKPAEANRDLWQRWYVVDRAARATSEEADEIAALVLHYVLLPSFKSDWPTAMREVADSIEQTLTELGRPVPAWVEKLRESAAAEELRPRPPVSYRRQVSQRKRKKKPDPAAGDAPPPPAQDEPDPPEEGTR
jgi:hypothetical protein